MALHFIHTHWDGFSRRPLLTAMMVFSIGFAAAGLVIWRCAAGDAARPACRPLFLVGVIRDRSRPRDEALLPRHAAVIGMLG
jgi:hypothetical protein